MIATVVVQMDFVDRFVTDVELEKERNFMRSMQYIDTCYLIEMD